MQWRRQTFIFVAEGLLKINLVASHSLHEPEGVFISLLSAINNFDKKNHLYKRRR